MFNIFLLCDVMFYVLVSAFDLPHFSLCESPFNQSNVLKCRRDRELQIYKSIVICLLGLFQETKLQKAMAQCGRARHLAGN